jgi:hypothetical protein
MGLMYKNQSCCSESVIFLPQEEIKPFLMSEAPLCSLRGNKRRTVVTAGLRVTLCITYVAMKFNINTLLFTHVNAQEQQKNTQKENK